MLAEFIFAGLVVGELLTCRPRNIVVRARCTVSWGRNCEQHNVTSPPVRLLQVVSGSPMSPATPMQSAETWHPSSHPRCRSFPSFVCSALVCAFSSPCFSPPVFAFSNCLSPRPQPPSGARCPVRPPAVDEAISAVILAVPDPDEKVLPVFKCRIPLYHSCRDRDHFF